MSTSSDYPGTRVELSGGWTHYDLSGPEGGKVVVLLHGGTIPMWTWDRQVPVLVEAGFRVLRYDMFGRGRSDSPRTIYERTLYETQLLDLLDGLGLVDPIHLVGISFGGGTSANFTVRHPERVDRIALIAPVVTYKHGKTMVRLLAYPYVGELLMRLTGVRKIRKRAGALWRGAPGAARYERLFHEQIHSEGFVRSFLSMMRTDALGDYRDVYRALGSEDRRFLLVWGTADEEIPQESIRFLRDVLPALEYHELEGIGHGSVSEAADRVNEILLGFHDRAPTPGSDDVGQCKAQPTKEQRFPSRSPHILPGSGHVHLAQRQVEEQHTSGRAHPELPAPHQPETAPPSSEQ